MKKLLTFTALGTVLLCANANASGFLLREQSVSGMGNAFAGATAGAEDASYSFYNPAALSRQKGTTINFNTTAIVGNVKGFNASSTLGTTRTQDEMDHVVDKAILPAGYISHQINDKLTAGLYMGMPFGLVTDYSDNWVGAQHGTLSDVKTMNINPMMSYKVNDKLSVGGGLVVEYITAKLGSRAGVPGVADAQAKIEGDTTDVGYNLGALYEFTSATRVGAGYRSAIDHKLKGSADFYNKNGSFPLQYQSVSAKLKTPELLTFGVYHDINDKWSVMAETQKTFWSNFKELRIVGDKGLNSGTEENWKDVWFYSIGASYKVDEQWKLRFGLAFDQTPVSDKYRTPRIPDSDRIWYSTGVEYKYDDKLSFNAGYTFIDAERSKVDLARDIPTLTSSLKAEYKGNIHLFGVSANYNF